MNAESCKSSRNSAIRSAVPNDSRIAQVLMQPSGLEPLTGGLEIHDSLTPNNSETAISTAKTAIEHVTGPALNVPNKDIFGIESANWSATPAKEPPMIGVGSPIMVKLPGGGWIVGECVCTTEKVCVVKICCIRPMPRTARENYKSPPVIDPKTLSNSSDWPPTLPEKYPLTPTARGFYARIAGKPKFICGKKSPRFAYERFLELFAIHGGERVAPATQYGLGDHASFPWHDVYVPAIAPENVVRDSLKKKISRWDYLPTMDPPKQIRRLANLKYYDAAGFSGWCVYFLCFKGHVVYVGHTRKLLTRLNDHSHSKKFDAVFYLPVDRKIAAKKEKKYILNIRPVYNYAGNPDARWRVVDERIRRGLALEEIATPSTPPRRATC